MWDARKLPFEVSSREEVLHEDYTLPWLSLPIVQLCVCVIIDGERFVLHAIIIQPRVRHAPFYARVPEIHSRYPTRKLYHVTVMSN